MRVNSHCTSETQVRQTVAEECRAKAKALSELPGLEKTLFHVSIATLLDLADEMDSHEEEQ